MSETKAVVFLNTYRDAMFVGYQPTHPLATADDLVLTFEEADDHRRVATLVFSVGNRMGKDSTGREWPSDVRSVSVGDVIHVVTGDQHSWLAVERVGFRELDMSGGARMVPLAGCKRITSRPAPLLARLTVQNAQAAALRLGTQRTAQILGPGGLSGATYDQLVQLIQASSDLD